jgi:hypothetical protein
MCVRFSVVAMDNSPWPQKFAKKQRMLPDVAGNGQATDTSPPLGGASKFIHGRSSDCAGSTLLAGLPGACGSSVILGFCTCLPLRGSSGFSPDSLFTLCVKLRAPRTKTTVSYVA